jgi:asparagine synthase (glutamine-hydrolysing)
MCGVTGIRHFDGAPIDVALLDAMIERVAHRGPDDRGRWVAPSVGLGHTRLSIIDLGGSAQPMASADGRYQLSFNGEILNYRQLRTELDYPFRTGGDTEVLLAILAQDGLAGCHRLHGQFAFALYDTHTGDLFLARDRTGILPMYYYLDPKTAVFGSEVKAMLPALPGGARLDHDQLRPYLRARAVAAPATLFAGVRKVLPGHYVQISSDGSSSVHQYWAPPDPSDVVDLDDRAAIDAVDSRLRDAVAEALVADVPVGAYLSGGLDSSLIVALAAANKAPQPIETFSADFGDPRYDETGFAELVSAKFATNHHVVRVDAEDFRNRWSDLTWHRDAPISEPADIAVNRLAVAAREHVKVVLSGEGADELFGGYPKYRFADITHRARFVPTPLRAPALRAFERALPARGGRLRIAVRALGADAVDDRMVSWFAPFTDYECDRLLGTKVRAPVHELAHRDAIDLMGRHDLGFWLADNLLERGDRMSMAASIELRPPFLDHELTELAYRLPSSLKVRDGQNKWVLRRVAERYVPAEVVARSKLGFRVPLDAWFRGGLREMARDLLSGPSAFVPTVLDPAAIARVLDDHDRGRRDENIRIWTLLSLEVWARRFLTDQAP